MFFDKKESDLQMAIKKSNQYDLCCGIDFDINLDDIILEMDFSSLDGKLNDLGNIELPTLDEFEDFLNVDINTFFDI